MDDQEILDATDEIQLAMMGDRASVHDVVHLVAPKLLAEVIALKRRVKALEEAQS